MPNESTQREWNESELIKGDIRKQAQHKGRMRKRRHDPGLAAFQCWTKITEKPNSLDSIWYMTDKDNNPKWWGTQGKALAENWDKAIVQRKQLNQSPEFFLGRAIRKLQVSIIVSLSLSSVFAYAKSESRLQAMLLSGGVAREETDLTRMHSFYKILLTSLDISDKRASLDFTLKFCCTWLFQLVTALFLSLPACHD